LQQRVRADGRAMDHIDRSTDARKSFPNCERGIFRCRGNFEELNVTVFYKDEIGKCAACIDANPNPCLWWTQWIVTQHPLSFDARMASNTTCTR